MRSQMTLIIIKPKYDINHKNKAFFHSKFIYHHDKKTYENHWRLVESYRDVDGLVLNCTNVNAWVD